MKKLFNALPTATIILLIFAIVSCIWGSDQKRMADVDDSLQFTDVSRISDNDAFESDGFFTTGAMKLICAPKDVDTGVTADGYVLARTVEMYQYAISGDSVVQSFSDSQRKDIEGKNGEKYVNPSFNNKLKTATFFGNVVMVDTGITVDETFLNELFESPDGYKNLKSMDNLKIKGYKNIGDGYYTNGDPDNWQVGDIRIKYTYLPVDAIKEATFCGKLDGDMITPEDAKFSSVSAGTKTEEDVKKDFTSDHGSSADTMFTLAGIEGVIAALAYGLPKLKKKFLPDIKQKLNNRKG